MEKSGKGLCITLAALLCSACGGVSSHSAVGQLSRGLIGQNGVFLNGMDWNGVWLNGSEWNGVFLNGYDFNGVYLNGLDWNGIELKGSSVSGVEVRGTVLEGFLADGTAVRGEGFIGAEFDVHLRNEASVRLRIDNIRRHPDPKHEDVLLYSISAPGNNGERVSICYSADGSPAEATVVAGRWDLATGTKISSSPKYASFACIGVGAIAKCVIMGYKPWRSVGGVWLEDRHQACTRMVRADYCGDGTPHTVNGTPIDVYDGIGVQAPDTNWPVDAEWGPNGALCVNNPRSANPEEPVPACIAERGLRRSDCGALTDGTFQYGGLLANKYLSHGKFQPVAGASRDDGQPEEALSAALRDAP